MDQLVSMVAQRVGIDDSQARTAVETVLNFLKERLPAPVAAQVDSVVGDGGDGGSNPLGGLGNLGGLTGG